MSEPARLVVGPFNRVEGDLEIRLEIRDGHVAAARVNSPLYRGFERMLPGKDPRDALTIVPRICGICSISQSAAAARALAAACGMAPEPQGERIAALIHAIENVSDHLTHFNLFFMPDFTRAAYAGRAWHGRAVARFAAMTGGAQRATVEARAALMHVLGLMAGKWPHTLAIQPGGVTRAPTARDRVRIMASLAAFRRHLETEVFGAPVEAFAALADLSALMAWDRGDAGLFLEIAADLDLLALGRGQGRYLSFGAYPLDGGHAFAQGVWEGGPQPLESARITEDLSHSWMLGAAAHPSEGVTEPDEDMRESAYSWCKAPRYAGRVMETGALARQVIDGHPLARALAGGGVLARVAGRLLELARSQIVMEELAAGIRPEARFMSGTVTLRDGAGEGLVEAARGALGHWLRIEGGASPPIRSWRPPRGISRRAMRRACPVRWRRRWRARPWCRGRRRRSACSISCAASIPAWSARCIERAMRGVTIRIRGQVQGVGFRPFVWQLAREAGLRGEVLNDPEGVLIRLAGAAPEGFLRALRERAPLLARVDAVEVLPGDPLAELPEGFHIAPSEGQGAETRVTPDAATCPACRAEIFGPGRRQGYAFTNCTHCGPRFSILNGLPYDRARTSMAGFAMCAACAAEYADPADRRFHAQPIACPACGPRLWYEEAGGPVPGDAVALAAAALRAGRVVAIRGIGGFHLACDAANADAVALLRARKRRPAKPFALMGDAAMIAAHARPTEACWQLLRSPAAPVVLVPARGTLPEALAPGMRELGVMLPYTPLHHLLLAAFGGMLVMTSGNLSGAPQVIGNAEARAKLAGFADGFVMHDREIARRLDDGVERADPPMVLRRARGRVPGTLPLPPGFEGAPQVLAFGGQMKAAICLLKNGQAMLSHHLGDLDDALTAAEYERALGDCAALFDHRPEVAACDLHPGFRATARAEASGLPLERVQHHHAHMAAAMAENLWPRAGGKVVGVVLDGLGLGTDGTVWGGEILLGDYLGFERRAFLRPAPLPGGDRAQAEPWRNALMRLDQAGLGAQADALFADAPRETLRRMAAAGVNTVASSSVGRLFDAVAAVLGLSPLRQSYEGEAAMRLEALAGMTDAPGYDFGPDLDPAPMLRALLAEPDPARAATLFHAGLARAFAAPARAMVARGEAAAVALSGGCFQNALLLRLMLRELEGLTVLAPRQVPANDGGLAFGQAVIAAARHLAQAETA